MKKKRFFHQLVFIFLMMFGQLVYGQVQGAADEVENLYTHTEQVYSTDDLLVNGQIYIPLHPKAKGDPYFGENRFTEGSVSIKGRQYSGLLLKYNIENQRLILLTTVESGKYVSLLLNSNLVDAFAIGGLHFVHVGNFVQNLEPSGYFAEVYAGNFLFLIKYEKKFKAVYNNQERNGSYTKMQTSYFVFEDGEFRNITKKKALLNYFSLHKKEINTFMRKHKIRYKKAGVEALNQLMKYCDSVSTNR